MNLVFKTVIFSLFLFGLFFTTLSRANDQQTRLNTANTKALDLVNKAQKLTQPNDQITLNLLNKLEKKISQKSVQLIWSKTKEDFKSCTEEVGTFASVNLKQLSIIKVCHLALDKDTLNDLGLAEVLIHEYLHTLGLLDECFASDLQAYIIEIQGLNRQFYHFYENCSFI